MELIPMLLKEMEQEAVITRKMLAAIPDDKYDWKPHEKSMSILQLSTHIAELPTWTSIALTTAELDFATMDFTPPSISKTADVLELFEKSYVEGRVALQKATEEDLLPNWTMRKGEQIYSILPKHEVIRMSYNQTTHHRAQLGVFLRLLNVPIPGSYGPSADDPTM
jgi:uncharacterized damage-inducible protein DinB